MSGLEQLKAACVADPADTAAACECAEMHLNMDLARGCVKYCDKAITADKACVRAFVLKAKAQLKMKKTKKARASLVAGIAAAKSTGTSGSPDGVELEALLDGLPVDTSAMLRDGHFADAIPHLQKKLETMEAGGGQGAMVQKEKAACLCDLAEAHLQLEMARACVKHCDAALASGGGAGLCLARAYALKAQAQAKMGKRKKATATLAAGLDAVSAFDEEEPDGGGSAAAAKGLAELRRVAQEHGVLHEEGGGSGGGGTGSAKSASSGGSGSGSSSKSRSGSSSGGAKPSDSKSKRDLTKLSVWNSKSTWEEVDLTDWAITQLEVLLQGLVFELPGGKGSVKTTKLAEVDGYCQIVHFQGRMKFLFEFSFVLGYLAQVLCAGKATSEYSSADTKKFKGRLLFDDVSQDCDEDSYEVSIPFNKTGDGYDEVAKCLKSRSGDGLQALVVAKVQEFERALHELPKKGGVPQVPPPRSKKIKKTELEQQEEAAAAAQQQEQIHRLRSDPRIKF